MESKDAYIKRAGEGQWAIGSASVERVIAFDSGKLLLKSFKNKFTGFELVQPGAVSDELFAGIGETLAPVTGSFGDFQFVDAKETLLNQGELRLDIVIRKDTLEITKTYVVFPGSSVIREWVSFMNTGQVPVRVTKPSFLRFTGKIGNLEGLDLHWIAGAENYPGSWKMHTEGLSAGQTRKFDSFDPFKAEETKPPGDGVNVKIMLNGAQGAQIWPESGWAYTADSNHTISFNVAAEISQGDKLLFITNMNRNFGFNTTLFDPAIKYEDGEAHSASKEFTTEQGRNNWQYQYIEKGEFVDLVYYPGPKQWRKAKDNPTGTPFVSANSQHPHPNQDVVRVWTATKSGKIRITGTACNTGNVGTPKFGYGFKMGSTTYAPWFALLSKDTKEGLFIGFDYFGHWVCTFEPDKDGNISAQLAIGGFKKTLNPGESFETPKAFIGLFNTDIDNAGNELIDWQYGYMWDYIRDSFWFPAVRCLGYWYKGTSWTTIGWLGGDPDWGSAFRKIFRTADLMRYIGADVYHRDWGWWDRAGDWNGPDFKSSGEYLSKYGMGQLIYAFLYTVDPKSKVAMEHPDWLLGGVSLDMSKPEVIDFMKSQLDGFYKKWGRFEWRNDSNPFAQKNGNDTILLGQDQGFRRLLKDFLDTHPDCAFQPVNGGGNCAGYDYVRFGQSLQFSDGAVGVLGNYWATLLFPPDKINNMPDIWDPARFEKSTWLGLLCGNFDMTGDTWDEKKLEGLRMLVDIYHYLQTQGVVGRWSKVYRPVVTGDDPTMYFQRLSADRKRGIIITKHRVPGHVTIKPKGLIPEEKYFVSFQETENTETRTGADLMEKGFEFDRLVPGELIYLNIPLHPGSSIDKEPPSSPTEVKKQTGENMGYPGVELSWISAKDNNWVSCYEIYRNGSLIDKVSKGTFYFDHSAGADINAKYEICADDATGNKSAKVSANGMETGKHAKIYDDAGSDIKYSGEWESAQEGLFPCYNNTITGTNQKGSSAELSFAGKKLYIFAKLGDNCGIIDIFVDGKIAETIDTYSADDIFGACVFRKEFAKAGKHSVKIEIKGERGIHAKDSYFYLDGIRVEQ